MLTALMQLGPTISTVLPVRLAIAALPEFTAMSWFKEAQQQVVLRASNLMQLPIQMRLGQAVLDLTQTELLQW
jgi:hypothetical protein